MSEEEFLARWSRRKQEAREGADIAPPSAPAPQQGAALPAADDPAPATEVVDLSNLPSIDSIDAMTDVTAFLRQGIPQELTRAALRRAWSADPTIRDFIGLAENAWDFNDPNAMPGFGPLDYSAEQLQALVGRVIGSARNIVQNLADAPTGQDIDRQSDDSERMLAPQALSAPGVSHETSASEPQQRPAAMQPEVFRNVESAEVTMARRTHGSALPR